MGVPLFLAVEQVLKDPVFNRDDRYFLSNDQAFDTAAKKAVHIVQSRDKLNANNAADRYFVRTYVCYICGYSALFWPPIHPSFSPPCSAVDEELPTSLNDGMFIPSIEVTSL